MSPLHLYSVGYTQHFSMKKEVQTKGIIEIGKNHSQFMEVKLDLLEQNLKRNQQVVLQTKLKMPRNKILDCKQYIESLKEDLQMKAFDQIQPVEEFYFPCLKE